MACFSGPARGAFCDQIPREPQTGETVAGVHRGWEYDDQIKGSSVVVTKVSCSDGRPHDMQGKCSSLKYIPAS